MQNYTKKKKQLVFIYQQNGVSFDKLLIFNGDFFITLAKCRYFFGKIVPKLQNLKIYSSVGVGEKSFS